MLNVRSVKNKFLEIEARAEMEKYPDLTALTETWLSPPDEQLFELSNYNAEFNSRDGRIALYIKENVQYI